MERTWFSFVAPVITDETFGFDAHHAIASWANETPSSEAIGFTPFTFLSVSSVGQVLKEKKVALFRTAQILKEKKDKHI